jgi:CubicO group peptidase (beta-lactamase class C family)
MILKSMPMKHLRNMSTRIFTFLSVMLLCAVQSNSQVIPDSLEIKVDAIFQEYNNSEGPGCAIAVISNGKTILKKSYGMANLEQETPISPTTVFDIASLSKQFTGYAISSLIQEGKISENDDIRKYLPYVPDFGKTITINHLLHHTSGLRDWPETLGLVGWRSADVCSFDDIIRMVQHQKDLDFEPGTRFSYSNTGYNLLAAIIEAVSGKTLEDWLHENLFSHLKMSTAQIPNNHTVIIKNLAHSYVLKENNFVKSPDLLTAFGSSSLFTSLNDMTRWAIHFDEQINLKNPVYSRMLEAGKLITGDTVYYGFGIGLNKEGEPRRVAHTGGWVGFRSMITFYPDEHFSVIVLSNSGNFNSRAFSQKIVDIMHQREVVSEESVIDFKHIPDVNVEKKLEEKYQGTYQLGSNWYITIAKENGRLMCRTNGEGQCLMAAKSDSTYWVEAYTSTITFVNDDKGGYLLKFKSNLGKPITVIMPDTKQLNAYVGKYYSHELSTEYTLAVTDGKLWMYHIRLGDIQLFPDPDEGSFGCEIGTFKFITNAKSEITGFNFSGSRVRNIHFDKQ